MSNVKRLSNLLFVLTKRTIVHNRLCEEPYSVYRTAANSQAFKSLTNEKLCPQTKTFELF